MLTVDGVTKTYDPPHGVLRLLVRSAHNEPVVALRGIDFCARPGEIVGLVGPNGAGKSTLIRICTTLLTPTSGHVTVDGADVVERPEHARRHLGVHLGDERGHYWRLSGRDNLRFFGVMAGLPRREARDRADELLERFGLAERDRLVFGYSSGMRVRLGLARALIARPKMLILDEPSRSLDPIASLELQAELRRLADDGTTVVLSSHRLDEVESVCDRVLVIVDGSQRAWTTTSELARGASTAAAAIHALLDAHADDQEPTS